MRHNEDLLQFYSAVCSYTYTQDNDAWNDTANTHWGNGLEIWFR